MQLLKFLSLVLVGVLLAFGAGTIFFISLFQAPKLIAGWMPGSIADKIGLEGVALFGAPASECSGKGAEALKRVLDRLQRGETYGRPFKLHLVNDDHENAFALPGRHIVLASGLLKRAETPEEIAGVLAHEMGHGLEKDPEALFLRNIGMKVIFKFTTLDDDRAAFRAMLTELRYSREAEVKADAQAIAILRRARISAKPAGEFILRSAAESPAGEGALDDLGAHLPADERAKLFLSQQPYDADPILSHEEWAFAKAACAKSAPGRQSLDRGAPREAPIGTAS